MKLALLIAVLSIPAQAHDAPKGWAYPMKCCAGIDCREVGSQWVRERPEGYVIANTGEIVGYGDSRVHDSPDGAYHWCSTAGSDDTRTICLFVPPKGY